MITTGVFLYLVIGLTIYHEAGGLRKLDFEDILGCVLSTLFWPIFIGAAIVSYIIDRLGKR